jgi:hypothetical protein
MLIDRTDEHRFAETLAELFLQPDDLHRLGDAAKAWIEENFTIARIAEQYEAFYLDVLSRRTRRRSARLGLSPYTVAHK